MQYLVPLRLANPKSDWKFAGRSRNKPAHYHRCRYADWLREDDGELDL